MLYTESNTCWTEIGSLILRSRTLHKLFPYIVPHGEGQYPEVRVDPHLFPDSVWRDPSLRTHRTILGSGNLDPNNIVNLAANNPDTQSKGSEAPETAVQRFTASGAAYTSQEGPVEAGFAERAQLNHRRKDPGKIPSWLARRQISPLHISCLENLFKHPPDKKIRSADQAAGTLASTRTKIGPRGATGLTSHPPRTTNCTRESMGTSSAAM